MHGRKNIKIINIEVKNYLLNLHIDNKIKLNPNIGGTERKR